MSYDQFASPFTTGLADPRSLYRSTPFGEALASLRYGIEARKGFILFTGEAGTGKSTLLQELTRELSANVTCALVSDPHLSFAEIIRSILLQLQVEPESTEEPALLRQCLTLLRSQVETGRIPSVIFDDAHHLRDRVVEQVVRNFIVGPAAPRQYLAQIILAGRPELKEQLFRPPPHTLASPAALECQLRPLSEKEVGAYIEHRLRAADLPADLFEPAAIQRIAAYSGGKLRLVNAIGDRAFPSADFSLRRHISPEFIEATAKDLDLWQPRWVRKEAPEMSSTRPTEPDERQPRWVRKEAPEMTFTRPKEPDERSDFGFADDNTAAVGQTFFNINDDTDRKLSGGNGRALRILSMLVLLGASIVWLDAEPTRKYLGEWRATLGEIIGSDRQIPAQAKTATDVPPLPATEEMISSAPPSSANDPQPQDENQKTSDLTYPEMEKLAELPSPVQQETPSVKQQPIPPPKKAPVRAAPERQTPPRDDSDQQKRELATQVSKAIANRAIGGIGVSVIDGTAYLNGRVATERQRRAAERAALAIPDVRAVQNRITIE
jgi:general secretion pathway protein A